MNTDITYNAQYIAWCNAPIMNAIQLADCQPCPAAPAKPWPKKACKDKEKEEGNTPMNTNSERDYLASRLENAKYSKNFRSMFNLDAHQTPTNYKDLIAAIQGGKFTLDTKRTDRIDESVAEYAEAGETYHGYGPLYGIIFTDLPKADGKGFAAASSENNKQFQTARDIIMTQDATAGLKALQDYEAWMPTVTPVATTTA